MIVVCHMFQYYDNVLCRWFNVGVQIFFVISGFLYGTREFNDPVAFIKKSFIKILIPYYLFLIAGILLYAVFCPSKLGIISTFKAFICAGTISGLGHLWFVGYILFCYLITPYLYWIRKSISLSDSWIKVTIIYIAILGLLQMLGWAYASYFTPDRVSCYVIGFFAADMIKRYGQKFKIGLLLVFASIALLTNGIEIYVKYCWSPEMSGETKTLFYMWCRYAHLFLGVALFFGLNEIFKTTKYSLLLKVSDKYSYPVYIVHLLFILSPLTLMSLTVVNLVNWFIVVFSIIAAGVVLQVVSSKITSVVSLK